MVTNWKARDWALWAKKAGIRAVKTFAQTASSMVTVGLMISEVDWRMVASISAVAGVYSILTSIVGLPEEAQ